jgi:hypothetical protein
MPISPMLKFALDSFEEAVEQYKKGTDKGRRYSVLHCDHTIELVLKDRLRRAGVSIYKKNSNQTIEYHDMLNALINNHGVRIAEYPDLRMIHDERNRIQHTGATISDIQTRFYLNQTYQFIKRFLTDEMQLDLYDHIDRDYYNIFKTQIVEDLSHRPIQPVVDDSIAADYFFLPAYARLEKMLLNLSEKLGVSDRLSSKEIIVRLVKAEKLEESDSANFDTLRTFRIKYVNDNLRIESAESEIIVQRIWELSERIRSIDLEDANDEEVGHHIKMIEASSDPNIRSINWRQLENLASEKRVWKHVKIWNLIDRELLPEAISQYAMEVLYVIKRMLHQAAEESGHINDVSKIVKRRYQKKFEEILGSTDVAWNYHYRSEVEQILIYLTGEEERCNIWRDAWVKCVCGINDEKQYCNAINSFVLDLERSKKM